jgi:mRNA interferase MazF
MIKEGDIILFPFPYSDLSQKKLRPALVLKKLPGIFDDWLICMISSQTHLYIPELDEIIKPGDEDFESSRLKVASVIRVSRLAVVESTLFEGILGEISPRRLNRIKENLANWLLSR